MQLKPVRAATVVATATAAIALAACGDDQGATERTLRFTEGQSRVTNTLDVPPRTMAAKEELTPGDGIVFNKPLLDAAGKPAGRIYASCSAATGGSNPRGMCDGVIQLRGGILAFTETFRSEDETRTAAITGGTGAYAGATGTFHGAGETINHDVIHLILP